MKAPLFKQDGTKSGEVTLSTSLFGAGINSSLVHLALVRQHANARISPAHALRRGEVVGSTRKVLRQKGSGSARKGDIKSPIFRGGGVAWGPRNDRNWRKEMPKKQRRLALVSVLSAKAKESKIIALEDWKLESPKTKKFAEFQKKLPTHRSVLVIHNRNESLVKSARNLKFVKPLLVNLLNIHDLTKYDQILFEKSALEEAEKIFKIEEKSKRVKKTETANAGVV